MQEMEKFQFVYTAVVNQYVLAFIRPISLALQDKQCDLVEAHNHGAIPPGNSAAN